MKKILGKNDIEDALKRLDTLTQEEARMATAEIWKATRVLVDSTKNLFSPAILCISENGLIRRERSNSNHTANCERRR